MPSTKDRDIAFMEYNAVFEPVTRMLFDVIKNRVPRGTHASELSAAVDKMQAWASENRPFLINTAANYIAQAAACTGRLDDLAAAFAMFVSTPDDVNFTVAAVILDVLGCAVHEAQTEIVRYCLARAALALDDLEYITRLATESGSREIVDAVLEHAIGVAALREDNDIDFELTAFTSAMCVGDDAMFEHLRAKFPGAIARFRDGEILEAAGGGSAAALECVRPLMAGMPAGIIAKVLEFATAPNRPGLAGQAHAGYAALAMELGAPPTPAALELVSRNHPAATATVAAVLRRWGGTAELAAAVDQLPGARWFAASAAASASVSASE